LPSTNTLAPGGIDETVIEPVMLEIGADVDVDVVGVGVGVNGAVVGIGVVGVGVGVGVNGAVVGIGVVGVGVDVGIVVVDTIGAGVGVGVGVGVASTLLDFSPSHTEFTALTW